MRDKVFDDKEDQLIDIHDIKCKEWGFLLKKLFGVHLGTGDYGHLTIDHSAMLLRQFRSMYKYSGQGFESSHKLHRQLFAKATNHDASGPGQSLDQILTHWYATHMLSLRHLFRQAMDVLQTGKKKFTFRGCGWKTSEAISLSEDSREWIVQVDKLFCDMFGSDFLFYKFNKEKGTSVTDEIISSLTLYDHELWEKEYIQQCSVDQAISSSTCTPVPPKKKIKLQQAVLSPALNTSNQSQPTKNPSTISTPVSSKKKIVSQPQGSNTTINHSQPSSVLSNSKTSIFKQSIVMSASYTRGELASLLPVLPPVKPFLLPTSVKAVNGTFNTTDPCTLTTRPSESVVSKAELVLQKECSPAVYIPGLGIFNEDGIADFRKFCDVAKTAKRVSEEADWLVQVGCTSSEQALIADALWQKSPNSPLLKRGKKMIDVLSFSDLAQERYIDNFVIDICICMYLEEAKHIGCETTLYFPTELYDWIETNDKDYLKKQLSTHALYMTDDLTQVLVPVYMPRHWGLVYIDLLNKHLYFDDGLKVSPPNNVLPCIKKTLDLLSEMYPTVPLLNQPFWHSFHSFSHFGMPSQRTMDPRMIGVGSCGIGVIMAAKDLILNGPDKVNNIQWRFCEMDRHRKELMLQILAWSSAS